MFRLMKVKITIRETCFKRKVGNSCLKSSPTAARAPFVHPQRLPLMCFLMIFKQVTETPKETEQDLSKLPLPLSCSVEVALSGSDKTRAIGCVCTREKAALLQQHLDLVQMFLLSCYMSLPSNLVLLAHNPGGSKRDEEASGSLTPPSMKSLGICVADTLKMLG